MIADEKLRIAMICAHSCPVGKLGAKDTGGMSVYVREIARELGKAGHSVDVYTRVHDPRDSQIIELGRNARLIHLKAGENGEMHKLDVYPHLPEFTRELESFRKQNRLRYDLIYSHYWLSVWVGRRLQKKWDVPQVAMFHTLGAVKNAIGIGEGEPQLRVETERRLVNNCHRIIVATEKEKKDIVLYYDASPQTISVIPCGVNRELFRPADREQAKQQLGINGERKNILFVGRIEPLKGIDKLLMAVARLKDKRGIRLLIIGGDENSQHEMARLKRLSGELRMQESVSFLGLVKQDRLPLFYNAADACVIPSYYESFGLVALESLACGTPVVTTRVGGAESVVRQVEVGYVVEDNTPRRLAEKIELLLSRPGNNAGSVKLMRTVTAEFSWSVIAAALVREYRSVLADYFARKTSPPPSRTRDCVTTL